MISSIRVGRPLSVLSGFALVVSACTAAPGPVAGTPAPSQGTAASAAATAAVADRGEFKIGLFNTLSGPFASQGSLSNDGFNLYLEQHGGKLAGYTIKTITVDEAGGTAVAQAGLRRLVEQEKVNFVFGPTTTADALALRDYIDARKIPSMVSAVSADSITQSIYSPWLFRIEASGSQAAHVVADYVCKKTPYRRFVLLSADFPGGVAASGGFARVLTTQCQGKILQEMYAPIGTTDWGPVVSRIDKSADALYTLELSPDAVGFLKGLRAFGLTMPIFAHASTVDENLLPAEGKDADGIISGASYVSDRDDQVTKAFVKAFQDKYNKPASGTSAIGYSVGQVIDAALQLAGNDARDPAKFREALTKVRVPATPKGAIRFDDHNQGILDIFVLKTVFQGGAAKNTLIDTYHDVSQFWTWKPEEFLKMKTYDDLKGTWAKP